MPLIDIWKAGELHDKRVQQILGFAGDGTLLAWVLSSRLQSEK